MILFYLVSIAVITVVVYCPFNPKCKDRFFGTDLTLVLGEIIGNFIGQLRLRYVIDILQLGFAQFDIFNIANSAITARVVPVFVCLVFMSKKN